MNNMNATATSYSIGGHHTKMRAVAKESTEQPATTVKSDAPAAAPESNHAVPGKSVAHQVRAVFAALGDDVVMDKPFGQYVSHMARFGSIDALLPAAPEEPLPPADDGTAGPDAGVTDGPDAVSDPGVIDTPDPTATEADDSVVTDDTLAAGSDSDGTVSDDLSSAEIAAALLDDVIDSAVDDAAEALT